MRGGGDSVIKPVQRLGWANGQSGNPTSTTAFPLCDPATMVRQREGRQKTKQEKGPESKVKNTIKVCMHEFMGAQSSLTDTACR